MARSADGTATEAIRASCPVRWIRRRRWPAGRVERDVVAAPGGPAGSGASATWRRVAYLAALSTPLLLGFGAFAALKWLPVGERPEEGAARAQDELAVWELLVAGGVVVWALLAGAGFRMWRNVDDDFARRSGATVVFVTLVWSAALLLLLLGWFADLDSPTILRGQQIKNAALHVVALVAVVPFLVVLKRIQLTAVDETCWS